MIQVHYDWCPPSDQVGRDGDYYVSTGTKYYRRAWLYGPKKQGRWDVRVPFDMPEPAEILNSPLR